MIFLKHTIVRAFSHTVELSKEFNQIQRLDIFTQLSKSLIKEKQLSTSLQGFSDKQGTHSFFDKKIFETTKKRLISDPNISLSSVGLGTYKGTFSEQDDIKMFNAIIDSINMGVNVIDTCNNFRAGRSQIVIGLALRYLTQNDNIKRNQLFISSKAGYVRQNLPAKISQKDFINDHCVHPLFLESCLRGSLQKMNLKTLDVFYLNNFSQCQLQTLGQVQFQKRLSQAFAFCEKAISQKMIKSYGLSSWKSFRVGPKNPLHLNLENIVKLAQKIGGRSHGFKFLQTPINIMMPEAFAQKTQPQGTLLQTAQHLKINVISNSPLLNGSLINVPLPAHKLKCRNNGAKHLQLIRSIPSESLVCTLIGHKLNRHVKKNLQVLNAQSLKESQWVEVFIPSQQPPVIDQNQQDDQ